MATGCPYWTVDIGAFFVKNNGWQWFWAGDYNSGVSDMGYRELYTRMFQYATFLPIQRSHGTDTPREIWNFGKPGEMFYDAILDMLHLRYRLLPYIYSMAGMVTCNNYTMTRALAFVSLMMKTCLYKRSIQCLVLLFWFVRLWNRCIMGVSQGF